MGSAGPHLVIVTLICTVIIIILVIRILCIGNEAGRLPGSSIRGRLQQLEICLPLVCRAEHLKCCCHPGRLQRLRGASKTLRASLLRSAGQRAPFQHCCCHSKSLQRAGAFPVSQGPPSSKWQGTALQLLLPCCQMAVVWGLPSSKGLWQNRAGSCCLQVVLLQQGAFSPTSDLNRRGWPAA